MNQLTPEEEKKILDSPPLGTFALMLLVGALIFICFSACSLNTDP